jgi:hypothetical protein
MMKRLLALLIIFAGIQGEAATVPSPSPVSKKSQNESAAQKKGGLDLFADLLYWFASEEASSVWASVVTTKSGHPTKFEGKNISFDWNWGFRVGAGYNLVYYKWDTQLYWSWYRTKAHSKLPKKGETIFSQFYAGFINGDIAESGKIHWSLLYNMIDWELGRNFWISKYLAVRPFIGLKGGWIDQTIHSSWVDEANSPPWLFTSRENLKNNFWGVGPSAGFNTKWKLNRSEINFLSLVGDFSLATLWGNWECKDKYHNSLGKETSVNTKDSTLGALMLRGFLGLGWDHAFNRNRAHFALKAGYEMQLWLNQLRIPTFQQLRLHGDLTLQGGTLECRLDF